eukprot:gene32008-38701_t
MQGQIDKLDARVAILETYLFGLHKTSDDSFKAAFPELSSPSEPTPSFFNTVSMSPSVAERNWLGLKSEPLEELPIKDSWLDQLVATPPSTPPPSDKKKPLYTKEDMLEILREMTKGERSLPSLPLVAEVVVTPETTPADSPPKELQRSLSGPVALFAKSYSEATVADLRDPNAGGWEKVEPRGRAKSMGDCKRLPPRTVEKVTASSAVITIANTEKPSASKGSHKGKESRGAAAYKPTTKVTPEPSPKSEVKYGLLVQYPDR